MNIVSIIEKKKLRNELNKEEIDFFAQGAATNTIPDYQLSALLMAIRLNGMNARETTDLTLSMANSGDIIDLKDVVEYPVDKHSTGGVADTTSLILTPLVASCGVDVAKMSGRGLGHTGGTIDKLESIPGMSVSLSEERFKEIVKTIGVSIIGQTGNLAPADKSLYALRDVTSTVDSIPLIASSIMSKKIAGGAKAIVLDVKTGSGAILHTVDESIELAKTMVDIGTLSNRPVVAIISNMSEPLGTHVGNALEVKEAIDILAGKTKNELLSVSLILASHMLCLAGKAKDFDEAHELLEDALESGRGLKKFKQLIEAQGGDSSVCDNTDKLPKANIIIPVKSTISGNVCSMDTMKLGYIGQYLGAGRKTKEDVIDPAVGFIMNVRIGDKVKKGDLLATIHANNIDLAKLASTEIIETIHIEDKEVKKQQLVFAVIDKDGVHMNEI